MAPAPRSPPRPSTPATPRPDGLLLDLCRGWDDAAHGHRHRHVYHAALGLAHDQRARNDPGGVLLPVVPRRWRQQGQPVHQLRPDPRPLQHRHRHGAGADRGHAVRRHHARHRVVVRPGHGHRQALAVDDPGRAGHRVRLGALLRDPRASPTRRRSRSPTTCTTCAPPTAVRIGLDIAGQGHGRVRLQRRRPDRRPRAATRWTAGTRPASCCSSSTARRSTSTSRCSPATPLAPELDDRRLAPVRPGERRSRTSPPLRATARIAISPGYWKSGDGLRHRAVPGPRSHPLAGEHRRDERLRRQVAADHDVQRVGRGHRDRELLRLPGHRPAGTYCDWSAGGTASDSSPICTTLRHPPDPS